MKKKHLSRLALALLGATVAALIAEPAFAGGLSAGTSAASNFNVWLYAILGILASAYLSYKGVLAWTDKEHWSDFGYGCLKVSVVGAVSVLAPWLWGLWVN